MDDEEKYRIFFRQSRDAIYLTRKDGRLLDVNDAMLRLVGYTRSEMLRLDVRDLYLDLEVLTRFHEEIERRGSVSDYEIALRAKDGTTIDCLETASVRRNGCGRIIGYQGIIRGITRRKHLEEQLRQAQKLEALGSLAGGVAHDFNNLLTGITGYSQLALSNLSRESSAAGDIRRVIEFAHRAAELTRRLLTFSRTQPLEKKVFSLNTLIERTCGMLRPIIGEQIDVQQLAAPNLGNVRADPAEIQQVVLNLAINARDAMPKGGRLVIATEQALSDLRPDNPRESAGSQPYAVLAVSDTGCGMDEETRAKIFEPFFTTKKIGDGSGLGLATVRGIVEQHGGKIHVHSRPGKGTLFEVYLPIVDADPDDLEAQLDQPIGRGEGGDETVLLVEDEEAVRAVIQRTLSAAGYEVLVATTAGDARRLFSDHGNRVRLLLTDIVMPETDGPTLFLQLTRLKPTLKILYMSGYPSSVDAQDTGSVSGRPFIRKPFTPAQIVRKVRTVLDGR